MSDCPIVRSRRPIPIPQNVEKEAVRNLRIWSMPTLGFAPMLFQINGTHTRILGSMHRVPKGQTKWIAPLQQAFDWAEQVFVETHPDEYPAVLNHPMGLWVGSLHPALTKRIAAVWPSNQPPFGESTLLRAMFVIQNLGIQSIEGVEGLIKKWCGTSRGLEALETPDEFLGALATLDVRDYANDIDRRLVETPAARKRTEQICRAWQNADRARLWQVLQEGMSPTMARAFLTNRNQAWAPKISRVSEGTQQTLIIVGAGHLCGPDSLLSILERDFGLTTTQVTFR